MIHKIVRGVPIGWLCEPRPDCQDPALYTVYLRLIHDNAVQGGDNPPGKWIITSRASVTLIFKTDKYVVTLPIHWVSVDLPLLQKCVTVMLEIALTLKRLSVYERCLSTSNYFFCDLTCIHLLAHISAICEQFEPTEHRWLLNATTLYVFHHFIC